MVDVTAVEAAQQKLNTHVKGCEQCRAAKKWEDCCKIGRVLACLVDSILTR
jgi:hypothetical protein